jgi:uncharacterized protein (DUF885 family)
MARLCTIIAFLTSLAQAQTQPSNIGRFFADTFEEMIRDEPERATGVGRHEYDNRWTDWSKAGRDQRHAHLQARLDQLGAFRVDQLSEQDRLTARLMQYDFRIQLAAETAQDLLLRVSQQNGYNEIYITVDRMPARTVQDYETILARLRAVPAYVDQNLALLDEATQRGMTQPQIVAELVEKQLAAQIGQDASSTGLLAAFRRFPSNIPASEQTRLRNQAVGTYQSQFLPAWRKLHDYIAGKYARSARAQVGLGSIPGGHEQYAALVRQYTTTNLTPEQIHQTGLEEVQRLESQMLSIARETGFTGTLDEFRRKLDDTPDQHFHNREEMLAYCRNIAKQIEPELPVLFKRIPVLLYGIRPIPEDREAATATNAQAPAPDYSAPGWMNLNAYQPEKQFKFDKESLVMHEAVPGHIFQLTTARALTDLPNYRKFYGNSAYIEGWGLYAESLGEQLHMYRDPYSHFGQLSSELFRAVRLVVDTGIHEKGWTRDQAIAYFREHAPAQSLAEIDRYIAWPGQALSYKMGQLKILELRRQAERELGPKFDIREYHDVVLRDGVLPLELLQEQVQEYIRSVK